MAATILQKIVETKWAEIGAAKAVYSLGAIKARAAIVPPPRDFFGAVACGNGIRLIAEIKKASPSAGLIRSDFDPVSIACIYESAGAAALSVLTDKPYFQGDLSFIDAVRSAVDLPVLRKDFIVDEYQIYESRAAGADAILLIAAILTTQQIETFAKLATSLRMTSLVETHDEAELRAVRHLADAGRRVLLGINNRDLSVQRIDLSTTTRLASMISGTSFVAESGLQSRADVLAMQHAGACGVLIGETFMRAPNIAAKVRELMHD